MGARRSAPERASEERSAGILMEECQFSHFNFTTGRGEFPKSTMTLKKTKSESGPSSLRFVAPAPLGTPWRSRAEGQSLRCRGAKKNIALSLFGQGGNWELAPSQEVGIFFTPSRRQGTPRSGAGGSGLQKPWAPWESSVEVILAVGEGLPCVGVRGSASAPTIVGVAARGHSMGVGGSGRSPQGSEHNSLKTKIKARDGSGRSPQGSEHNSLKTKIKARERKRERKSGGDLAAAAVRHLYAIAKGRS